MAIRRGSNSGAVSVMFCNGRASGRLDALGASPYLRDGALDSCLVDQRSSQQESTRVTGPRGEEFDSLGRAAALRAQKAPPGVPAQAGGELLVIKDGGVFLCTRRDGEIRTGEVRGEGLYFHDTRYLSELRMSVGGTAPVILSSSADLGYAMVVDATNRDIRKDKLVVIPQQTLSLRRFRFISDRLYERINVRNFGGERVSTTLELLMSADFADMFEVRGMRLRKQRGHALAPKQIGSGVTFAYVGEDELFRETVITFDPAPKSITFEEGRARVTWHIALEPGAETMIFITFEPSQGGKRKRSRSFVTAEALVKATHDRWRTEGSAIHTNNELFDKFANASIRDLCALMTPTEGGEIIAAGIPWYVAPFGRDSLLTAYEMLLFNPAIARGTLKLLAYRQARTDDPWRDAEPGKILHEIRAGELARSGYIPHSPYFGSVDATPLFVMLAAAYYRWTNDMSTLVDLLPAIESALAWMDSFGDLDGDGFIEYLRRAPGGMDNQGWKDSGGGIVHADGSLAEPPIALSEVQGYTYLAKLRIADVFEALGDAERASTLRKQAGDLKTAFNEAFWMPDEGTFAVALDGRKRQVKSITSNPGHCLYCDIVEPAKAGPLAERLMAPDMFSGWGIRTLSADSPAYNPMSYHNGSVWPHDNILIAAGMKRHGYPGATEAIATALLDAALVSREARLPEVYCGFFRREGVPFVAYPVACSPQAWASAVPFMMIQSLLGISARAPDGVLTVNKPRLPPWLNQVHLSDIAVGMSKVSLAFSRHAETTAFSLVGREGDVRVTIEE